MFKSVESQLWVTKAVRQWIPSRRARNSKTQTTETVQSVARYGQLVLSGRAQTLTTMRWDHTVLHATRQVNVPHLNRPLACQHSICNPREMKGWADMGGWQPPILVATTWERPDLELNLRPHTHKSDTTKPHTVYRLWPCLRDTGWRVWRRPHAASQGQCDPSHHCL